MAFAANAIPGLSMVLGPVQSSLEELRTRLGREVVSLLSTEPEVDLSTFATPAGDPGLFPPDSPVWEVHADTSMFVGGIRALLFQAMHPLAMAGVAEHSDYRRDPLRRLQRTATFIRDTTFGNTQRVDTAIKMVRRVHTHVKGIAPDGRPYSASSPDLLRWVHVAEIDSFLAAHVRYGVAPLSASRTDRYVDEMAEVALRLGADWVPRSFVEMQSYLGDMRGELVAGDQARDVAQWLLNTPAHPSGWLPQMVMNVAAVGLLPGWVRRELGLVLTPFIDPLALIDPVVVQPTALFLVRTLGWALAPNVVREAAQQRWQRVTKRRPRAAKRPAAKRAKS